MLTLIIVSVAAFFNAVMDTLAHHFGVSIFKYKDPDFWDARTSAAMVRRIGFTLTIFGKKRKFIDYPVDAWHITKSLFLALVLIALPLSFKYSESTWPLWLQLPAIGFTFVQVFNMSYDGLLRSELWVQLKDLLGKIRRNLVDVEPDTSSAEIPLHNDTPKNP